jgi:glucose/arabinose dehydrogenase
VLQVGAVGDGPGRVAASFVEQGLLGIAVDPDFLNNRYVYVYYTDRRATRTASAAAPKRVGFGTNLTVLTPANGEIPTDWYHNGGTMVFGHDGTLYVATGDNYTAQRPGPVATGSARCCASRCRT